jgi:hypothetical protein
VHRRAPGVGGTVFSLWHPLIALLFAGPFLITLRWFFATFPVLQIWQPMAAPESIEAERPGPRMAARH